MSDAAAILFSTHDHNNNSNKTTLTMTRTFLHAFLPVIASILFAQFFYYVLSSDSNVLKEWEADVIKKASSYRSKTVAGAQHDADSNSTTLDGVVILITGATSGIGHGLTKWSYQRGATVIAMGRSSSKLETLQKELVEVEVERNSQRFFPVIADFADLESVSSAVDAMIRREYHQFTSDETKSVPDDGGDGDRYIFPDHIDILVNNAGMHLGLEPVLDPNYKPVSKQGFDLVFQTNYLAHFLLTEKLLPTLLARSASPRVVQVTSTFHVGSDGSDLYSIISSDSSASDHDGDPIAARPGGSDGFWVYRSQRQYANSKLAQILHSRFHQRRQRERQQEGLDDRRRETVVFTNACPAWVGTSILRHSLVTGSSETFDDAWEARAFRSLAFSPDSFGLSSILRAMFDDSSNNSVGGDVVDSDVTSTIDDYFINTKMMRSATSLDAFLSTWLPRRWSYEFLPIRDLFVMFAAYSALPLQRFSPATDFTKSSRASYDEELQDNFYLWSRQAVDRWL